jgi:hypothetical protein
VYDGVGNVLEPSGNRDQSDIWTVIFGITNRSRTEESVLELGLILATHSAIVSSGPRAA